MQSSRRINSPRTECRWRLPQRRAAAVELTARRWASGAAPPHPDLLPATDRPTSRHGSRPGTAGAATAAATAAAAAAAAAAAETAAHGAESLPLAVSACSAADAGFHQDEATWGRDGRRGEMGVMWGDVGRRGGGRGGARLWGRRLFTRSSREQARETSVN